MYPLNLESYEVVVSNPIRSPLLDGAGAVKSETYPAITPLTYILATLPDTDTAT